MKRRSFIQTIATIGFLAPLLKVKPPKPLLPPQPKNYRYITQEDLYATAHAGTFSTVYTDQLIKSTHAMSRKIERGIFTNEV